MIDALAEELAPWPLNAAINTRMRIRQLSLPGVAIALVIDVAYTAWVNPFSGHLDSYRGPVISGFVGLATVAAVASWLIPSVRLRAVLLGLAAAGIGLTGLIGMFTIGLPLMLAAGFIGTAAISNFTARPTAATILLSVTGALIAVALLVGGLYATELPASCGSMVSGQGAGGTWWHGDYSYSCEGGSLVLTTRTSR